MFEGERLRVGGTLPDARRSSGRSGCGAVTTGLVGGGLVALTFVNG